MLLTIDDFLRVGACESEVVAWHEKHTPKATAVESDKMLGIIGDDADRRDWVLRAAGRVGSGSGYGDGSGYG